jgi:threonine/homoserine/homoserine lactone efflux protein
MDYVGVLPFLAITVLLIVTPGSDMALISRATMRRGQRGALAAMLGINLASVTWTILAAIGFVAIVKALPFANAVLLTVGALFMGYIGIKDIKVGMALKRGAGQSRVTAIGDETYAQLFRKASS